LQWQP